MIYNTRHTAFWVNPSSNGTLHQCTCLGIVLDLQSVYFHIKNTPLQPSCFICMISPWLYLSISILFLYSFVVLSCCVHLVRFCIACCVYSCIDLSVCSFRETRICRYAVQISFFAIYYIILLLGYIGSGRAPFTHLLLWIFLQCQLALNFSPSEHF